MHPSAPRRKFGCSPLILLCLGALSCLLQAAPYQGESFTYHQPDGETFTVRLFGDEFFAYEETTDGHLVTRDPKTGEFCYARVTKNGTDIISTGVRVGKTKPAGLKPKQRLTPAAVMAHSRVRRDMFGVDDEGRIKGPLRDVIFRKQAKRAPDQQAGEANADIQWDPALDGQAQPAPGEGIIEGPGQPAPLIPVTVNKRVGLVLMAYFPDRPGDKTKTREQIDTYCNARPGEAMIDGNATSVYGYFYQQSNGRLEYNCVVTAWFQAANNRNYYTDNTVATGIRARELIHEGLAILDAQGFDFRQCDADDNGVIDGINIFYAGARTNAWAQGIWPHKSSGSWAGFTARGLATDYLYQITDMPAALGIGTFCHENGHMILNYPDLYPFSGSADPGGFSLMGYYGSQLHPCSIDAALKVSSGLAEVVDLDSTSHRRCAVQIDRNHFYRYTNPSNSGESFIIEVRGDSGYEGRLNGTSTCNPVAGLVMYHYLQNGSNTNSSILTSANPNANYSTPYKLLVVESNPDTKYTPWYDYPHPDYNDAFMAEGVNQVSDSTRPELRFWAANGRTTPSQAHVHSISSAGDTMSFVVGTGPVTNPAEIGVTTDGIVSAIASGTNAPAQEFAVFNVGAGTLNYSVNENSPWLSVSPASGSVVDGEVDKIMINFSTTGLSSGTYLAEITIASGQAAPVTIPVTLSVKGSPVAPTITTQPVGGHFLGDQQVVLSAWASGNPEPSYQWYKNDVAISGARSNNLTLTGITAAEAGTYHVVATNSLGTATSHDAVITVNDDPNVAWVTPLVDSIRLASNARLWLEANVTDDGYGGSSTTLSWTAPTVPPGGSITWANQNTGQTTATFSGDGVYVLRFTTSDGVNTRTRDIQVEVGGTPSGNDPAWITHYRFGEKSGTVAYDSAGTQQNATLLGGASFSGGELVLDGTSTGRATIANSTDIDTGGPYPKRTIMAWVKRNADTAANQFLFEQGGSTSGMSVLFTQGNSITCRIWRNGGGSSFASFSTTTPAIAPGSWFHIALVLDATPGSVTLQDGVYKLYINGQLQASGKGVALDPDANGIGLGGINGITRTTSSSNGSGPSPLPGRINDFRIYNRALSLAEINNLATNAVVAGPVVDAGTDATGVVQLPLQLDGTITVGGMVEPPSISPQWTTVSGPGDITYQNSTITDAIITADTAGTYVLRLFADDGEIRTFDDVTVTMSAANGPGYLGFGAANYTIAENGGSLQIPVRRTGGATGAVSVNYAATNGSATHNMDYALGSGTLNWADQDTSIQYITVNILNDLRIEGGETFSAHLSNPTGGASLGGIGTSTVTINDDEIPDTILFRDEFTAASGTSLTNPSTRATGTLASSITYTWTSTTDVVVNGRLDWDSNGDRTNMHQQPAANAVQTLRITNDLYPHVGGKVWELSFDQRVGWDHPLTFGLSDTAQTNPTWNLWDSVSFDFATGSYGSNLRYDTDNEGGTNGYSQAGNFPNPPNTTDSHHFRIRFDEPAGKVMVWINGIKKLDVATLDFESAGRYLCWTEPGSFAGAMDNLEIKVINTANGAPTWNGSPITTVDAVEGTPYNASLASLASDPNGDALVFSKVSGPTWLGVAADGTLSGTPTVSHLGNNTFTLRVADEYNPAVEITLNVTVRSRFQAWSAGATSFNGDANADGIADGIAWLLGAAHSSENGVARLPDSQRKNDGALTLSFRCLNAANRGSATLHLQFSRDMGVTDPWTNHQVAIPTTSSTDATTGVVFVITPNGSHDEVEATIPATAAGTSGRLFSRLMATEAP